jgi:peroxiredoxin
MRRTDKPQGGTVMKGKKAKDFTLKDQSGEDFTLSDHLGEKVLLSFHPLAWTPVCAAQMKSLEKNHKAFKKFNTVSVGLSVDSIPCKAAWAKSLKLTHTKILADFWPHGGIAKAFGLLRREGFSERANILIDEKGRICFSKIYPIRELPDIEEIIQAIKC